MFKGSAVRDPAGDQRQHQLRRATNEFYEYEGGREEEDIDHSFLEVNYEGMDELTRRALNGDYVCQDLTVVDACRGTGVDDLYTGNFEPFNGECKKNRGNFQPGLPIYKKRNGGVYIYAIGKYRDDASVEALRGLERWRIANFKSFSDSTSCRIEEANINQVDFAAGGQPYNFYPTISCFDRTGSDLAGFKSSTINIRCNDNVPSGTLSSGGGGGGDDGDGLSAGAAAAIAVIILGLVGIALFLVYKRKQDQKFDPVKALSRDLEAGMSDEEKAQRKEMRKSYHANRKELKKELEQTPKSERGKRKALEKSLSNMQIPPLPLSPGSPKIKPAPPPSAPPEPPRAPSPQAPPPMTPRSKRQSIDPDGADSKVLLSPKSDPKKAGEDSSNNDEEYVPMDIKNMVGKIDDFFNTNFFGGKDEKEKKDDPPKPKPVPRSEKKEDETQVDRRKMFEAGPAGRGFEDSFRRSRSQRKLMGLDPSDHGPSKKAPPATPSRTISLGSAEKAPSDDGPSRKTPLRTFSLGTGKKAQSDDGPSRKLPLKTFSLGSNKKDPSDAGPLRKSPFSAFSLGSSKKPASERKLSGLDPSDHGSRALPRKSQSERRLTGLDPSEHKPRSFGFGGGSNKSSPPPPPKKERKFDASPATRFGKSATRPPQRSRSATPAPRFKPLGADAAEAKATPKRAQSLERRPQSPRSKIVPSVQGGFTPVSFGDKSRGRTKGRGSRLDASKANREITENEDGSIQVVEKKTKSDGTIVRATTTYRDKDMARRHGVKI